MYSLARLSGPFVVSVDDLVTSWYTDSVSPRFECARAPGTDSQAAAPRADDDALGREAVDALERASFSIPARSRVRRASRRDAGAWAEVDLERNMRMAHCANARRERTPRRCLVQCIRKSVGLEQSDDVLPWSVGRSINERCDGVGMCSCTTQRGADCRRTSSRALECRDSTRSVPRNAKTSSRSLINGCTGSVPLTTKTLFGSRGAEVPDSILIHIA